MEELSAGIRELHARVKHLDEQLRERGVERDLHERLGAAAMDAVERTRNGLRWLWICGVLVAVLWTPMTAYGAVWVHEKVRNNCYPAAVWSTAPPPPTAEPWYCGLFPGTDHPEPHRHGP